MKKLPILMTASVSTNGMKGACFTADEREKMYLETIRFYISELLVKDRDRNIVFAENSGWNLNRLKESLGDVDSQILDRIEWIGVDPGLGDVSKGKGYNEILLIGDAVGKSSSIGSAGAFLKVTGRYPIYNIRHYVEDAERYIFEKSYRYYGDMKDHHVYDILRPSWGGHAAGTILFAATNEFFSNSLYPTYSECNDYTDNYIEIVWFHLLKPYRGKADSGMVLRFDEELFCGGMQGSVNDTVVFSQSNQSFMAVFKRRIRNFTRRFMPWFWI